MNVWYVLTSKAFKPGGSVLLRVYSWLGKFVLASLGKAIFGFEVLEVYSRFSHLSLGHIT
jgi:hypothetical protein